MANKKEEKINAMAIILPSLATAIVGVIAAVLSYQAGLNQITIPLNATQTAEARNPALVSTVPILSSSPTVTVNSIPQVQLSINSCDDYGIKITSPVSGDKFPRNGTLHGTYTRKPESVEAWIFSIYKEAKHIDYRPRNIIIFDDDGTWVSESKYLGEIDSDTELAAFIVGKDARILINYHNMVGGATEKWFAITELPSDLIPCSSSVMVKITPPN